MNSNGQHEENTHTHIHSTWHDGRQQCDIIITRRTSTSHNKNNSSIKNYICQKWQSRCRQLTGPIETTHRNSLPLLTMNKTFWVAKSRQHSENLQIPRNKIAPTKILQPNGPNKTKIMRNEIEMYKIFFRVGFGKMCAVLCVCVCVVCVWKVERKSDQQRICVNKELGTRHKTTTTNIAKER